jgi:hypothetical protein
LFKIMSKLPRKILVIGGAASVWGYHVSFDSLVSKLLRIAREHRVPAISGAYYYKRMELFDDGVHFARTDDNKKIVGEMVGDFDTVFSFQAPSTSYVAAYTAKCPAPRRVIPAIPASRWITRTRSQPSTPPSPAQIKAGKQALLTETSPVLQPSLPPSAEVEVPSTRTASAADTAHLRPPHMPPLMPLPSATSQKAVAEKYLEKMKEEKQEKRRTSRGSCQEICQA